VPFATLAKGLASGVGRPTQIVVRSQTDTSRPDSSAIQTQALTQPFHLVTVPRVDDPVRSWPRVRHDDRDEGAPARGRPGGRGPSPATACGAHDRLNGARLGGRGPSPATACGAHYQLIDYVPPARAALCARRERDRKDRR